MGGVILNIRFFISAFYSKSLAKLRIILHMTKFFTKNLSLKSIFYSKCTKNTVFSSKDDKWSIRIRMKSAEKIRNAEIPKTGNPQK